MKQMKRSYRLLLLLGISFVLQEVEALDNGGAAAKCGQRAEPGPCRATLPRWYWNRWERRCLMFTYGGCTGNDNNFESLEDCRDACKDVLLLNDDDDSDEPGVQQPPSPPVNPPETESTTIVILPKRVQPKKKVPPTKKPNLVPKTLKTKPKPPAPRPAVKQSQPPRPKPVVKKPQPPRSKPEVKKPQPRRPKPEVNKPQPPKPKPNVKSPLPPALKPKGAKPKPPTSKSIVHKNKVKKPPGPTHVVLKPKNAHTPKEKIEVGDTSNPGKGPASFWKCVRRGKKMSCVEDPGSKAPPSP